MAGSDFTFDQGTLERDATTKLERAERDSKTADPFAQLEKQMAEALQKDQSGDKNAFREMEISDTFDGVMNAANEQTQDLRDVFLSLEALAKQVGAEFDKLDGMHPEAVALLDTAKARYEAAKSGLTEAEVSHGIAQGNVKDWWLFKTGVAAEKSAASRLAIARNELASAETQMEEAPAKADQLHRQKIQGADMEEVSARIRAMHERANDLIETRFNQAEEALNRRDVVIEAARDRHQATVAEFQDTRTAWENQQTKVGQLREELEQGTLDRNTREYADLERRVSEAEKELGNLKANMDAAMGESQELEEKLQALEFQRNALITLKGNYERTLRIGRAAAKANQEITNLRIEILQGLSDLSVEDQLNSISRTDTLNAAENAASLQVAVEQARLSYGKDHAPFMKRMKELTTMLGQRMETIHEEEIELVRDWEKRLSGEADAPNSSKSTPKSGGVQPEATENFAFG